MKYLMLEQAGTSAPLPVLWMGHTTHADMAAQFKAAGWRPTSAGFCSPVAATPGFYCFGRSSTLDMSPGAGDAEILGLMNVRTSKTSDR